MDEQGEFYKAKSGPKKTLYSFDRIPTFVFWDEQEWSVFVGCWLVYGCQPRYSEMPLKEVEGG